MAEIALTGARALKTEHYTIASPIVSYPWVIIIALSSPTFWIIYETDTDDTDTTKK